MTRLRARDLVLVAVGGLVMVAALAGGGFHSAGAQTTTLAPTTTSTTTAPTTTSTTTAPTTSTSTTATSTTSSSSSTTSTTVAVPAPAGSSSTTPWGWIIAGIVAVVAIAAIIFGILRKRSAGQALAQWQLVARPARDDASIARDLLLGATTERGAPTGASVNAQTDAAAAELDRAAATAPDETRRDAATATAAALRGLQFALEAETLMREGATAPTAEQLAQADATRRTRTRELDQALARLDELVRSGEDAPPPTQP